MFIDVKNPKFEDDIIDNPAEGGNIIGKEEIRAYWTRQWSEFDPHVEPLAMTGEDGGKTRVRVHQLVKNLQGNVLSDGEVFHVFTISGGLIAAMDLGNEADSPLGRLPLLHIDPNWPPFVERESKNRPQTTFQCNRITAHNSRCDLECMDEGSRAPLREANDHMHIRVSVVCQG